MVWAIRFIHPILALLGPLSPNLSARVNFKIYKHITILGCIGFKASMAILLVYYTNHSFPSVPKRIKSRNSKQNAHGFELLEKLFDHPIKSIEREP